MNITEQAAPYIRVYIVVITAFNVTGCVLLLWALKKTRQTKTISFQFIIMISISDLTSSISNVIFLTLMTWREYNQICWVRTFVQLLLGTLNIFSFIMVALIALDRYLHMRYLQRYPIIVTKTRGHLLAVAAFMFSSIANGILVLPLPKSKLVIIQTLYLILICPALLSIMILYYSAMRILRMKAGQLTRNNITQTRALSKSAKKITSCIAALTLLLTVTQAIEMANEHYGFTSPTLIDNIKWATYITYLLNVFCSSFIFMSQNRPIKTLLARTCRCSSTNTSSAIKPVNVQTAATIDRSNFVSDRN